jgi:hypothetical protein
VLVTKQLQSTKEEEEKVLSFWLNFRCDRVAG